MVGDQQNVTSPLPAGWVVRLETQKASVRPEVQRLTAGRIPSYLEEFTLLFYSGHHPSPDWIRPTHIMENSLLGSRQHLHRNIQYNIQPNIWAEPSRHIKLTIMGHFTFSQVLLVYSQDREPLICHSTYSQLPTVSSKHQRLPSHELPGTEADEVFVETRYCFPREK